MTKHKALPISRVFCLQTFRIGGEQQGYSLRCNPIPCTFFLEKDSYNCITSVPVAKRSFIIRYRRCGSVDAASPYQFIMNGKAFTGIFGLKQKKKTYGAMLAYYLQTVRRKKYPWEKVGPHFFLLETTFMLKMKR